MNRKLRCRKAPVCKGWVHFLEMLRCQVYQFKQCIDVYLATLAGYYQLDGEQAISGSIRYFNLGEIKLTGSGGEPLGTSRPQEFGIDFGYSRKIADNLGGGVTLRYINSNLPMEVLMVLRIRPVMLLLQICLFIIMQ